VDSLVASFRENPELEEVMSLMSRGEMDFVQAVGAVISPEELQAAIDAAEDGTALKERAGARQKARSDKALLEKNMAESMKAIDAYIKKMGYDEERANKMVDAVLAWFQIWADGKITEKEVAQLDKLTSYDEDVSASFEDGKKAGKAQRSAAVKGDKESAAVTAGIGRVGSGAGTAIPAKGDEMDENDPILRSIRRAERGEW
jgi:hypothetical protein